MNLYERPEATVEVFSGQLAGAAIGRPEPSRLLCVNRALVSPALIASAHKRHRGSMLSEREVAFAVILDNWAT